MTGNSFTTTITADRTPEEVFTAINNVRAWWSAEIQGDTEKLGDEFTFHVPGVHRCSLRLTEVVPGKRVVWSVSDSRIEFIADKSEWDGTEIVFDISEKDGRTEVRFTHLGLVPTIECFDVCSGGWDWYLTSSLRSLLQTGSGDPHRTADTEATRHQHSKDT